jgi:hypothetical protein
MFAASSQSLAIDTASLFRLDETMTRYQKTVLTSFLVFLPAGIVAALWPWLNSSASPSEIVGGEIVTREESSRQTTRP